MDATRLRAHIDGALEAQRLFEAARKAEDDAREAVGRAEQRHRNEVANLRAALDGTGFAIYGADVVRIGPGSDGTPWVYVVPIVNVPVLAPLPAPLPEAPPVVEHKPSAHVEQPKPAPEPSKPAPAPTSGGVVPAVAVKKPGGK